MTLGNLKEYRTAKGRTVKLTDRLRQHIETERSKKVDRVRKKLIRTLKTVQEQLKKPEADPLDIQARFKQALQDHGGLLDMETDEKKELDPAETPLYEDLFAEDNEEIEQTSNAIKEYLVQETVQPKDSVSEAGNKSQASRVSRASRESRTSATSEAKRKLAEERMQQLDLDAQKEALLKKAELERKQRELEDQQRELEKEKQIAELDAKLKASKAKLHIMESLSEVSHGNHSKAESAARQSVGKIKQGEYKPPVGHSTPNIANQLPSNVNNCTQGSDSLLLHRMVNVMEYSQRNTAQIEPLVFSGDTLDYHIWRQAFEELVERDVKPRRRLLYLLQYTAGPAKEAIKYLSRLDQEEAYKEAMEVLEEEYGSPYRAYEAYMSKLSDWSPIKSGDAAGLKKFADFLAVCNSAMRQIPLLKVLDDPGENIRLVRKLPKSMGSDWSKRVDRWLEDNKNGPHLYPPFSVFKDFVKQKARVEAGPVLRSLQERSSNTGTAAKPARVMKTDAEEEQGSAKVGEATCNFVKGESKKTCNFCSYGHDMAVCRKFAALSLKERYSQAREKKVCRRYLEVGHMARTCDVGPGCKECGKGHHALFHDPEYRVRPRKDKGAGTNEPKDDAKKVEQATASSTNVGGEEEEEAALIVPVMLRYKESGKQRKVYAVIDHQADCSFVRDDIMEELDAPSVPVHLHLKTMAGSEIIDANRLSGLEVTNLDGSVVIPMRKTYSRETISASYAQIATPAQIKKWTHLELLHDTAQEVDKSVPIAVLIGRNMPRAVKPRDCLPGDDDDPYAVKTSLGWGVIGNVSGSCPAESKSVWTNVTASKELSPHQLQAAMRQHLVQMHHVHAEDKTVKTDHVSQTEKELAEFSSAVRRERTGKELYVNKVVASEISPQAVKKMFDRDFSEREVGKAPSMEDREFLRQMDEKVKFQEGHVVLPLPMKNRAKLPSNKQQALALLKKLRKKLLSDASYCKKYIDFMNELIEKGYAERVSEDEVVIDGEEWYLPHHGVFHPQKLDKLRVVFNSSVEFKGEQLNRHLLKGPDMTNGLIGVLCRFRRKQSALTGDLEKMFYQVKMAIEDRNYVRFVWYPDGDLTKEPVVYRMTVHPFGATSSPGCANYALKYVAKEFGPEFSEAARRFIEEEFYVDDGLTSEDTVEELDQVRSESQEICRRGGFRLHKFLSNEVEVLERIPIQERSKEVQIADLVKEDLPVERTLGCGWDAMKDVIKYKVVIQVKPSTRRGILATVTSIYDPLGLVSPFILKGKQILKELCMQCKDWDEPITATVQAAWSQWKAEAPELELLEIRRCYVPRNFGKIMLIELHHFSDAAMDGYGQCSYIRHKNEEEKVSTALVAAKARVTPTKMITIPRLELTAATLSAKMATFLNEELKMVIVRNFFYCDSQPVLCYILNEFLRFHIFVGNRVQLIRELTSTKDWHYIETSQNPADLASRGCSPSELKDNPLWLYGPKFLVDGEYLTEFKPTKELESDPEVRKSTVFAVAAVEVQAVNVLEKLERLSEWNAVVRAVAVLLRLKKRMMERKAHAKSKNVVAYRSTSVSERQAAESEVVKKLQHAVYAEELPDLDRTPVSERGKKKGKHCKRFQQLDAFLDEREVIRVGGRLRYSSFTYEEKHPAILPGTEKLVSLLIREHHAKVLHCGRESTIQSIRTHGYWITSLRKSVDSVIRKCVHCRRYRGNAAVPRMADLPMERLEIGAPFTVVGVNIFGPFLIKIKRSQEKRYGCVYTCFASRAIHLEVLPSLRTDDFLNAYTRFSARRGPAREIWSDQGTNLIGAANALREEVEKMFGDKTEEALKKEGCDLVAFKTNPPHASHMGGVWERQIRTVRSTLNALMDQHQHVMYEDLLKTVMCHAESIVNNMPLTPVDSSGPGSMTALSPATLLTMKPKVNPPLPGKFDRADVYARARWRRAQRIAEEFWERWRTEVMLPQQTRKKWNQPVRALQVNDVVLLVDESKARADWAMGRVVSIKESKDGQVRSATIKTKEGEYVRPVAKVLVLIPVEKP